MTASVTRRSLLALALTAVAVTAGSANPVTKGGDFRLTDGDTKAFAFKPGKAGTIQMTANWRGTGVIKTEVALRMKLVRPDGSVAKTAVGGNPLPLSFAVSAAEFARFEGKNWQVVMENTVPNQKRETVTGNVSIRFDDGQQTLLAAANLDVAGNGVQQVRSFQGPTATGRLVADISFRDGAFDGKDLVAELVRGDGQVVAKKTGNSGLTLTRQVSQADLAAGRNWTIRLTNNEGRTVRGIDIKVVFTPN